MSPEKMVMDKYTKDSVKVKNVETLPDGKIKCEFEVSGDEKHDHLTFNYWMQNNAKEFTDMEIKFDGKEDIPTSKKPDGDFTAVYTYYFEPEEVEPIENEMADSEPEEISNEEPPAEDDEEMVDFDMTESLQFNIAKEQIKRYNEGKMPSNWDPKVYLENLVNHEHISSEQKHIIEEAFLTNK